MLAKLFFGILMPLFLAFVSAQFVSNLVLKHGGVGVPALTPDGYKYISPESQLGYMEIGLDTNGNNVVDTWEYYWSPNSPWELAFTYEASNDMNVSCQSRIQLGSTTDGMWIEERLGSEEEVSGLYVFLASSSNDIDQIGYIDRNFDGEFDDKFEISDRRGVLQIQILLDGEWRPVDMGSDPNCAFLHGAKMPNQEVRFLEGRWTKGQGGR